MGTSFLSGNGLGVHTAVSPSLGFPLKAKRPPGLHHTREGVYFSATPTVVPEVGEG